jgi:enoyl-CoA hydratase/carnithine racemase
MTRDLFRDLTAAGAELESDDDILVVILQSNDPDFFIAHFDVELLVNAPQNDPSDVQRSDALNVFDLMCERFATMPKVTIAKIAGRAGGGGSELAMACDMRFGAIGAAVVNQMEVPIGILPGGGGTQRLPRLVGYARAAEVILGGVDLDAATGEQWGYFNRALPPDELDAYVGMVAQRIADSPPQAVRLAKAALLASQQDPTEGLITESFLFDQLMAQPESRRLMQRFLDLGGQTRDGERNVADLSHQTSKST